jgi:uncharacterized protein involved in tolerance to divalent cations
MKTVRALHSYEIPEFIEIGITRGEGKYLAWIEQAIRYE